MELKVGEVSKEATSPGRWFCLEHNQVEFANSVINGSQDPRQAFAFRAFLAFAAFLAL